MNKQGRFLDNLSRSIGSLTARQYGEVVLPDAASGQGLGSPRQRGRKAVTVQGGYGAVFAVMVQGFNEAGRVAVQV